MLVEHLLQRRVVTSLHRVELATVDVERLAVVRDTARVGVADRSEAARDAAHRRLDRLVAARPDEDAVEHRVGAHHARALAEVTLEQVDRALELRDVGGGGGAHRLVDDRALEHASRVQDVDGSALLELHRGEDRDGRDEIRHDEHAARLPAAHLDEAGELEHAERLAQGRLRDPELGGERSLVREPVARAEAGTLDRLGEVLDRCLERPRCPDRLDGEAHGLGHRGESRRIAPYSSLTAKQKRCFT